MNSTKLILVLVLLGVLIWLYRNRSNVWRPNRERVWAKSEHKHQVMELFLLPGMRVKNDDVQRLTGVSDATATRYLDELEKEGLIRQVGVVGGYVYYEKIGK